MKKMKRFKKIVSLLLTAAMVLGMSATTFAAATTNETGIQIANLTIKGTETGKQYDLYRVLDLTYAKGEKYSYTINENFKNFFDKKSLSVGNLETMTTNASELQTLSKELLDYAVKNKVPVAKSVTGQDQQTVVSDLQLGYYLLNPLGGSVASTGFSSMFALNTLSGNNSEITVKAVYPTISKNVMDDNEDYDKVDEISIGKEVTFKLETKVPDTTGYNRFWFVISDNMSKGLDFIDDTNKISVSVGNLTLNRVNEEAAANDTYTLTATKDTDGTKVEIVFNNFLETISSNNIAAGTPIIVTYKAKLNEDAEVGTDKGNPNKVVLIYSNDPKHNYDGNKPGPDDGDVVGKTPEMETKTYTTSLSINKTDGTNPLKGAAFRISGNMLHTVVTTGQIYTVSTNGEWYKLKDGTYTETAPTDTTSKNYADYAGNNTPKYALETKKTISTGDAENVSVEAYVDSQGHLTFAGLGVGEYTITETVTPNGYNSIDPIKIKIEFIPMENATELSKVNPNFKLSEWKDGEWKEINNGSLLSMTIVNKSGSLLPSTGGIGTTIFYIIGGILVLGAAILLITKKRMREEA